MKDLRIQYLKSQVLRGLVESNEILETLYNELEEDDTHLQNTIYENVEGLINIIDSLVNNMDIKIPFPGKQGLKLIINND